MYLGVGADAILTGLSTNSSLASVPITLRCLEKMNISPANARLAACVGTNLNNDGITLYEAIAALFLAQAVGMNLGLGQQVVVVLASIMAGAGVAGVPEAGLVVFAAGFGRGRSARGNGRPCFAAAFARGLDYRPRPLRGKRDERYAGCHFAGRKRKTCPLICFF